MAFASAVARPALAVMAAASLFSAPCARADVLLDTTGRPNPSGALLDRGLQPKLAVPFTASTVYRIESIVAAIQPDLGSSTASVSLGIMSDASGLPSDVFLHSVLAEVDAGFPTIGQGWLLSPGKYWLAAIASGGNAAVWLGGDGDAAGGYAIANDSPPFFQWRIGNGLFLPSAIIVATPVPEARTWVMMLAGLLVSGLAAGKRRRRGRPAAAPAVDAGG